jgi:DNA-binding LacI/PurR family transcriptional regulator
LADVELRSLACLTAAGIEVDPALSLPAHFSFETAYETALGLVKSGIKFDAIFAASDVIALASIQALTSCGISIPNDVSVVGFDDIAIAAQSVPPLSTVQQDLGKGAQMIVDLLFKRIGGENAASITLEPNLIIRKSSAIT